MTKMIVDRPALLMRIRRFFETKKGLRFQLARSEADREHRSLQGDPMPDFTWFTEDHRERRVEAGCETLEELAQALGLLHIPLARNPCQVCRSDIRPGQFHGGGVPAYAIRRGASSVRRKRPDLPREDVEDFVWTSGHRAPSRHDLEVALWLEGRDLPRDPREIKTRRRVPVADLTMLDRTTSRLAGFFGLDEETENLARECPHQPAPRIEGGPEQQTSVLRHFARQLQPTDPPPLSWDGVELRGVVAVSRRGVVFVRYRLAKGFDKIHEEARRPGWKVPGKTWRRVRRGTQAWLDGWKWDLVEEKERRSAWVRASDEAKGEWARWFRSTRERSLLKAAKDAW